VIKVVLALQILILLLFIFFVLTTQNTINELSSQVETALTVIEDMSSFLPQITVAVENFNRLEPLFENLGRLSELLTVLTDPFGSNG
jgi:hypothetical protein|tara:strand:+ start:444 stop:704 length:261 start_codon:yes stop_codon:yes gene_type:complete